MANNTAQNSAGVTNQTDLLALQALLTGYQTTPTLNSQIAALAQAQLTQGSLISNPLLSQPANAQTSCTLDSATIKQITEPLLNKINKLQASVETLKQQPQNFYGVICTIPGCIVAVALIIALTAILLRKGFNISKGDTKVSIGGNEEKKN